jgi:hypothetical protein
MTIETPESFSKVRNEETVHVAVRELKEETYRALKWAGYSWGQSQSMGRMVGVAEIIWGSGISSGLADIKRRFIKQRSPSLTWSSSGVLVNTKGLSVPMAASFAVAISQSKPGLKVFVKGSDFGPEVATAVWDTKVHPDRIFSWGICRESGKNDYSVMPNGDLMMHERSLSIDPSMSRDKKLWFVTCHEERISGDVIMEKKEQVNKMSGAWVQGVKVSKTEWEKLSAISMKYLVPE